MRHALSASLRHSVALLVVACGALPIAPLLAQDLGMGVSTATSASAFGSTSAPPMESMSGTGGVSSNAQAAIQTGTLSGSAWSSAWGVVDYGHMQLQAMGGATLTGGGLIGEVSSTALAQARLTDSFLIACPHCVAGTEATVTFRLVAYGGLTVDGSASRDPEGWGSRFSAYADVSSGFRMSAPDAEGFGEPVQDGMFKSMLYTSFGSDTHDRPIWQGSHTARFTLGDPLSFTWDAVLHGSASAGNFDLAGIVDADSVFDANFGSTFYWGGISEVRDSNGQLLTGITAFNAAGVNYANALAPPVPEPAALWLMAMGALALVVIRKGKTRSVLLVIVRASPLRIPLCHNASPPAVAVNSRPWSWGNLCACPSATAWRVSVGPAARSPSRPASRART